MIPGEDQRVGVRHGEGRRLEPGVALAADVGAVPHVSRGRGDARPHRLLGATGGPDGQRGLDLVEGRALRRDVGVEVGAQEGLEAELAAARGVEAQLERVREVLGEGLVDADRDRGHEGREGRDRGQHEVIAAIDWFWLESGSRPTS